MTSTINASTTAGIVTTADTSGVLALQTAGTTAISIDASQNVNFAGTAQRITGDFSNGTIANRVAFQTSTANSATSVGIIPNGTGTTALINAFNNSDPTNSSAMQVACLAAESRINSLITGTGTYQPMTFYTGGSESLRLSATTKAVILAGGSTSANGTGITFPATQSASTDANTLDDYEEGTFTPTIVGSTSAGTGTYSTQVGTYTRVGRVVSFRLLIAWSAHTGTGSMLAGGLPFASSSVTDTLTAITVGGINNVTLSANHVGTALLFTNTTQISFYQTPVGGGSDSTVPIDTSASTVLSGTYFV